MGQGLRFRKVDLHVHTPKSDCFIEPGVTPEDIVSQALAVGLEAIAITDHNSAAWVDDVKAAATGTGLTVFPGVEITVQPGIHVVALFPEDRTGAHVTDLLSALKIGTDQRGNPEALVTEYGVQKVVDIIRNDYGALPVLAHIDAPAGAWYALERQTRIQLWQEAPYAAVEITGVHLPDAVGNDPYTRVPAFYWASDNPHPEEPTKHSHRGIGARYSCFKLDDPITWEGLRQCFEDPQVRIRRELPALTHPRLERVQVTGGFLNGFDTTLNPNLNCIIGGRGTGKSTLLEILRYTFDLSTKSDENTRQSQKLLGSVFPAGARITAYVRVGETVYRIERTSGRPPEVFLADSDEQRAVAPADLLPLQIYGQKEIYHISLDSKSQLRLLDNYVAEALRPLVEEENRLVRDLRANADEILRLEDLINDAQEGLGRLGAIQEEIRRMEDLEFVERVRQKDCYDREKRLLDGAQAQVAGLLDALERFPQQQRLNPEALGDAQCAELPNASFLRTHSALLQDINGLLEQHCAALRMAITAKWAEGEADRAVWQAACDQQEQTYRDVLHEFANVGEIGPDRYIQLKTREAELEARAREVEQQRQHIATLLQQRAQELTTLRTVRRRQYETRCQKTQELTVALQRNVRVTLWPEGHRQVYKDYLKELFAGLNVREPQRSRLAEIKAAQLERAAQRPVQIGGEIRYLIPEIPRYLDPIDLAEAIRLEQERADDAASQLEERFGVDSDAIRRNMAGLSERQLFELELFRVPDLPVIELKVGRGDADYRSLEEGLSVGQRCTALLSMILLESDAPLLIDQPEDDLDNQFIFDQIVATLRHEKERRQFLIATHNANIPVSGDADLITVLQADDRSGRISDGGAGSIDSPSVREYVTRILEGGCAAFRIRKEKYGRMIEA